MAQEFTVKSEIIESKINQLLPSQGGFGAGVDFSASTLIIPTIDLTETAEGSRLRQDLQVAMDFASSFNAINNTTTVLVNTTGFFRVFGTSVRGNNAAGNNRIFLSDGFTTKVVFQDSITTNAVSIPPNGLIFDFIVYLRAGDTLSGQSNSTQMDLNVSTRQVADVSGNLTNPLGFI